MGERVGGQIIDNTENKFTRELRERHGGIRCWSGVIGFRDVVEE